MKNNKNINNFLERYILNFIELSKNIYKYNRTYLYESILIIFQNYLTDQKFIKNGRINDNIILNYFFNSPFIGSDIFINVVGTIKEIDNSIILNPSFLPSTMIKKMNIKSSYNLVKRYIYNYISDYDKNQLEYNDKIIEIMRDKLYTFQKLNYIYKPKIQSIHPEIKENEIKKFDHELNNFLFLYKTLSDRLKNSYKVTISIIPSEVTAIKSEITEILKENDFEKLKDFIKNKLIFDEKTKQYYMKNDKTFQCSVLCNHTYMTEEYKNSNDTKILKDIQAYIVNNRCIYCNMYYSDYLSLDEIKMEFIDTIDYTPVSIFYIENGISDMKHLDDFNSLLSMFCNEDITNKLLTVKKIDNVIYAWVYYYANLVMLSILKLCGININLFRTQFEKEFSDSFELINMNISDIFELANNPENLAEYLNKITDGALKNIEWIMNKLNLNHTYYNVKKIKIKFIENANINKFNKTVINSKSNKILDRKNKFFYIINNYNFAVNNNIFSYFCPINKGNHEFSNSTKCKFCNYDIKEGLKEDYYIKYRDYITLTDYNYITNIDIIKVDTKYVPNQSNIEKYNKIMLIENLREIDLNNFSEQKLKQFINNVGINDYDKKDIIDIYKSISIEKKYSEMEIRNNHIKILENF